MPYPNFSQESFASHDLASPEDGDITSTEYEDKCIGTSTADLASAMAVDRPDDVAGTRVPSSRMSQACSQASIDRELAMLNQEMKNIQMECQSLVQKHNNSSKVKLLSLRYLGYVAFGLKFPIQQMSKSTHNYVNLPPVLSHGNKPSSSSKSSTIDKSQSIAEWVQSTSRSVKMIPRVCSEDNNTSSAYNTGDSCHSTPALTMELRHGGSMISLVAPPPPTEEKGTQFVMDPDVYSSYSCESCRQCREDRERRREKYANHEFRTLPARCPTGKLLSTIDRFALSMHEDQLHAISLY